MEGEGERGGGETGLTGHVVSTVANRRLQVIHPLLVHALRSTRGMWGSGLMHPRRAGPAHATALATKDGTADTGTHHAPQAAAGRESRPGTHHEKRRASPPSARHSTRRPPQGTGGPCRWEYGHAPSPTSPHIAHLMAHYTHRAPGGPLPAPPGHLAPRRAHGHAHRTPHHTPFKARHGHAASHPSPHSEQARDTRTGGCSSHAPRGRHPMAHVPTHTAPRGTQSPHSAGPRGTARRPAPHTAHRGTRRAPRHNALGRAHAKHGAP